MAASMGRFSNPAYLAQLAANAPNDAPPNANGQFDPETVEQANPMVAGDDKEAVQIAVGLTNEAAQATPTAVPNEPSGGTGAAAGIPNAILNNGGSFFGDVDEIRGDIATVENGSSGTLHWWGWELTLDEAATSSFKNLLIKDLPILTAALGAAILSPPLAAALAVVKVVSDGFAAEVAAQDTNNHGVTITAFCFVVPSVRANP